MKGEIRVTSAQAFRRRSAAAVAFLSPRPAFPVPGSAPVAGGPAPVVGGPPPTARR